MAPPTNAPKPAERVSVTINALGASQGGIVRVLECLAAAAGAFGWVSVTNAPRGARLPASVQVRSWQSPSRARSVVRALTPSLRRPRPAVSVNVAPAVFVDRGRTRTVQICNDLAFKEPALTFISWRQRAYRQIVTGIAFAQCDRIAAISPSVAGEIRRHYPRHAGKVVVAPLPVDHVLTAVDTSRSRRAATAEPVVLAFGHAPNKGVETLLRAMARRPELRARIVADRAVWERNGLARLAEELVVADRVTVLGKVSDSDLIAEYTEADVFCMPSEYEGYGLPVAEALALGVPTVISDLDVLDDTARGCAVRMQGSGADALLDAIDAALARDVEHWNSSSELFRRWTWHHWVRRALFVEDEGVAP